jgi:hypothetical protein
MTRTRRPSILAGKVGRGRGEIVAAMNRYPSIGDVPAARIAFSGRIAWRGAAGTTELAPRHPGLTWLAALAGLIRVLAWLGRAEREP